MRTIWIVLLSALLTTVGLLLPASRLANAQATADQGQVALLLDGSLNRAVPASPALQLVSHERCGVQLGGWCPGRVRSCLRSGEPAAKCELWGNRCEACNETMLACREKVGHQAGYTCTKCRKAMDMQALCRRIAQAVAGL